MFRYAVISILAVIAKQERIRIQEQVRAGLERARAQATRTADRWADIESSSGTIKYSSFEIRGSHGDRSLSNAV
jgi:hypothetical protein